MKKCLILISAVLICTLLAGCCLIPDFLPGGETPPAGTYAVSSIGTEDGSITFYSEVTEELLILNEDGTGSFYFDETAYSVALKGSTLLVEDEKVQYIYIPDAGQEAMLTLYWFRDGVNSIALRPVTVDGNGTIIR